MNPWADVVEALKSKLSDLGNQKFCERDLPIVGAMATSVVRDVEVRHERGYAIAGWRIEARLQEPFAKTRMIILVAVDPSGGHHDLGGLVGLESMRRIFR